MRKVKVLMAAIMAGALLVGCGTTGTTSTSSSAGKSASQQEVIKLGADVTFPPFEMMKDGKVTGFDIDLIKAIAAQENLKIADPIQTMDFQGLIPAIQTGTIDVAVAGMTITSAREQQVNFSKPYYHSGLSILVKNDSTIKGLADLKGKTVAVKLGTTADIMLSKDQGIKIKRFNNIDDAYNELQNGGAQAVVFDNPVNLNYINTGHSNVKVVGSLLTGEDYGIAVTKQNSQLLQKINDGLDKLIANGQYEKIYRDYFKSDNNGLIKK
ncbi:MULTISPECIES: basic amino acid ABC transporter substrate-binding protein [Desulfosporosinus]|uniref:Glutamine-binding periplasmic protein n=1 Tax=Desulfosporosinus acididurans TaxID=476652 RepID=A0A0J1IHT0_9FIRM|nr:MULTISPECIES: basic amino acid ABC transporter substrate-binding protein [Desulfosporosinus]KLU64241.1 glutamine-binding periplasmic protein precursor [Desulfosporosinus acididurans]